MSNVTVLGSSLVVQAGLSMEDLKLLEKHRPEALILKDDEENIFFRIAAAERASMSNNGICFDEVSNTADKLATITVHLPKDVEDKRAYVADKYGPAISRLDQLEQSISAKEVLNDVNAEQQALISKINITA